MGVHLHLTHKIMAGNGGSSGGHGRRRGEEEEGIRKGWMGIRVGGEGEEQQRFVVPVEYLSHPLFVGLLKEAEEEYGFDHQGAITIPCHVDYFRRVQGIIERDCNASASGAAAGHHQHHHHHFHLCFRA
ncbi:auxin-responsive protein SAUR32-like [Canna indica]|uniref:Auxin-responsive protein SAUR32-like n=1 Tax=Canna indica TaxID=4628 RepID=A0AAQ3JUU7_9LILI|nr:auxin-responsive protein SAUR32-like [Canna indica]